METAPLSLLLAISGTGIVILSGLFSINTTLRRIAVALEKLAGVEPLAKK